MANYLITESILKVAKAKKELKAKGYKTKDIKVISRWDGPHKVFYVDYYGTPKSNPTFPKSKFISCKAVKFNKNGSVSIKVDRKTNPSEVKHTYKLVQGKNWGTVKAINVTEAKKIAKGYGWSGKFKITKL